MTEQKSSMYSAPIFLGVAALLFILAALDKLLNIFGIDIPYIFPRQILDWAVTLLVFEIALTLRQLVEVRLES